MNPVEIEFLNPQSILEGAQFGDAYQLIVEGQQLDPLEAARRAVYGAPSWINRLLRLRTILVRPFGLKPGADPNMVSSESIGIFPILESLPNRLTLGLNDKHLDFRLLVDVVSVDSQRQAITVSTVVKTHNALGWFYLAFVKPFHRVIVPVMLRQAARAH